MPLKPSGCIADRNPHKPRAASIACSSESDDVHTDVQHAPDAPNEPVARVIRRAAAGAPRTMAPFWTSDADAEEPEYVAGPRRAGLQRLSSRHPDFERVRRTFVDGWTHARKRCPAVAAVFEVVYPMDVMAPYNEYKARIEDKATKEDWETAGNEQLLFHGTSRACLLGDGRDKTAPCTLPECCLCSVIRQSFDIAMCGTKHKFKRFGEGIYTTACSSKADDYCSNDDDERAAYRVLLLNRVVLGREFVTTRDASYLNCAPGGCDSVTGLPGEDLNYEETVVYRNDAVRPAFLVVYGPASAERASRRKLGAVLRTLFRTPVAS